MSYDFIPAAKPLIGDDERAAVDAVLATGMLAQGSRSRSSRRNFLRSFSMAVPRSPSTQAPPGSTWGSWPPGLAPAMKSSFPRSPLPRPATLCAHGCHSGVRRHRTGPLHARRCHVASLITAKTKGIMPVHLYGHPFDVEGFTKLAAERGIDLYEDAAQAHGASLTARWWERSANSPCSAFTPPRT